jgi:hypothetical protein
MKEEMIEFYTLQGVHSIVLTYNLIIVFQSQQNNYQNLIHISLCIMSILDLTMWQCATCFEL